MYASAFRKASCKFAATRLATEQAKAALVNHLACSLALPTDGKMPYNLATVGPCPLE
jgi:hypothetical protein